MKVLLQLALMAMIIPTFGFGQITKGRDVVASAGEVSSSPNLNISWTVGEPAVSTMQAGNLVVTEGMQQTFPVPTSRNVLIQEMEIKVFPNPVTDLLNFEISTELPVQVDVEVFDLFGRRVIYLPDFDVNATTSGQLDFASLSAGEWILKFTNSNQGISKTFKVLKLN